MESNKKFMSKEEFENISKTYDNELQKIVKDKIDYCLSKNIYNKYIVLLSVPPKEIKKYLSIIKKEMFPKNIYFNIRVINWLCFSTNIYLKIYDSKYISHIRNKFTKQLNEAIRTGNSKITMKIGIHHKDKLMAQCYVRNYNSILDGYNFIMVETVSGKYLVYIELL